MEWAFIEFCCYGAAEEAITVFLKQSILSDADTREGLKIVYDDVAPYAKENSTPQVVDSGLYPRKGLYPQKGLYPRKTAIREQFPDLRRNDLAYPGYALCLPRFALLDGRFTNFPDVPGDYGYISDEVSDGSGLFAYTVTRDGLKARKGLYPKPFLFPAASMEKRVDNPALTVSFNQKFTSVGILLTFNTMTGDYAKRLRISWYSDNTLLSTMEFSPNDTKYFCSNYVQLYNKLTITFYETSKPFRPVFLTRIDYGVYREFMDDEIKEVNCLQEINAISENISVNTMNLTVRTKSPVPFDLQKKQRLQLFFDGKLLGNFYLKNGAKKSKVDYYMDAHDAIGVLDGNEFAGGIYTGQTVSAVVAEIFAGEDINYLLDATFENVELHGYIPYTTKRAALQQIAFAIGAVVDTSNYDGVIIYPKQAAKSGMFSHEETYDGVTLEHSDVVTGIRLTVHSYQKSDDASELYKDTLNGTAEIVFSEAYYGLTISNGTIRRSGDNYAVITGSGAEVVLTGKKYNHFVSTVIKENPNIVFNKNVMEVAGATLVHSGNAQAVLERVYQYYQQPETVVGDVLLGDKVLGQVVEIDTMYDGTRIGTIERIEYDFTREIKAGVTIHE